MATILLLLGLLCLSYWQTIKAYPNNGGSYTVATENLGTNAGLLAAVALMVDYVLNVAVGISAGVFFGFPSFVLPLSEGHLDAPPGPIRSCRVGTLLSAGRQLGRSH